MITPGWRIPVSGRSRSADGLNVQGTGDAVPIRDRKQDEGQRDRRDKEQTSAHCRKPHVPGGRQGCGRQKSGYERRRAQQEACSSVKSFQARALLFKLAWLPW